MPTKQYLGPTWGRLASNSWLPKKAFGEKLKSMETNLGPSCVFIFQVLCVLQSVQTKSSHDAKQLIYMMWSFPKHRKITANSCQHDFHQHFRNWYSAKFFFGVFLGWSQNSTASFPWGLDRPCAIVQRGARSRGIDCARLV